MNGDSVKRGFLDRYLPPLVAVALAVVPFVLSNAYWKGQIEARLVAVEAHASSEVIHMPDAVKFSTFAVKDDIIEVKALIRDLTAEVRLFRRGQD